jgi:hypothetical protein
MRFQENAFDAYKLVLRYAQQHYATGDFVNHAYVRLFQNSPKDYGIKKEFPEERAILSGPEWKCLTDSVDGWNRLELNDQTWYPAQKIKMPDTMKISGFPSDIPIGFWYGEGNPKLPQQYKPAQKLFIRRTFYCPQVPLKAEFSLSAIDQFNAYLNGDSLFQDTCATLNWNHPHKWNLLGKIREGKNVLALFVKNSGLSEYGVFPYLAFTVTTREFLPQLPDAAAPTTLKAVSETAYDFPSIKNFPSIKLSGK